MPGNAPFPLSFGIPNAEPLSYDLSGYDPGLIPNSIEIPEIPENSIESPRTSYYHPKPKKDLEYTLNNPRLSMKQRYIFQIHIS